MKRWYAIVCGVMTSLLLVTSMIVVDTDEAAIVYRFGAINRVVSPGLSFRFPSPVEHDERIEVTKVKTIEMEKIRLLTADVNLVELKPVLQYTIQDPKAYVLGHAKPDQVLQQLVEAVITTVIGGIEIDSERFLQRALLQQRILGRLKNDLSQLELGIQIAAFELRELSAPSAVVDAFNEVSSARGDKDTMILSAQSYASKLLPDTRGQSKGSIERAHGEAARMRADATIRTTQFQSLLEDYRRQPKAIAQRFRMESWQRIQSQSTMLQTSEGVELVWSGESSQQ